MPGPDGGSVQLGAPLFACHLSRVGGEQVCAGWLALYGHQHVSVRLAIATGRLDPAALTPAPGWPALWGDYDEMVRHVAGPPGACRIPPPSRKDPR